MGSDSDNSKASSKSRTKEKARSETSTERSSSSTSYSTSYSSDRSHRIQRHSKSSRGSRSRTTSSNSSSVRERARSSSSSSSSVKPHRSRSTHFKSRDRSPEKVSSSSSSNEKVSSSSSSSTSTSRLMSGGGAYNLRGQGGLAFEYMEYKKDLKSRKIQRQKYKDEKEEKNNCYIESSKKFKKLKQEFIETLGSYLGREIESREEFMRALWDWKEGMAKKNYHFDVDKTEGVRYQERPVTIHRPESARSRNLTLSGEKKPRTRSGTFSKTINRFKLGQATGKKKQLSSEAFKREPADVLCDDFDTMYTELHRALKYWSQYVDHAHNAGLEEFGLREERRNIVKGLIKKYLTEEEEQELEDAREARKQERAHARKMKEMRKERRAEERRGKAERRAERAKIRDERDARMQLKVKNYHVKKAKKEEKRRTKEMKTKDKKKKEYSSSYSDSSSVSVSYSDSSD